MKLSIYISIKQIKADAVFGEKITGIHKHVEGPAAERILAHAAAAEAKADADIRACIVECLSAPSATSC